MKYIKMFEDFTEPDYSTKTEQEILSQNNFEDTLSLLNNIKKYNDLPTDQIYSSIQVISAWGCEVLGCEELYYGEGIVSQEKINLSKEDAIEKLVSNINGFLRFCSAGKYYDETVKTTLEDLITNLRMRHSLENL